MYIYKAVDFTNGLFIHCLAGKKEVLSDMSYQLPDRILSQWIHTYIPVVFIYPYIVIYKYDVKFFFWFLAMVDDIYDPGRKLFVMDQ
jgi:hypothetical protein